MADTNCPNCGAPLSAEKMNGEEIFPCTSCSTPVHPVNCDCWKCDMEQLSAELDLGLKGLAGIKAVRAKNEAARRDLGLPEEGSQPASPTVIIHPVQGPPMTVSSSIRKKCSNCGNSDSLVARFCGNCGEKYPQKSCHFCSMKVDPDAAYCYNCGEKQHQ